MCRLLIALFPMLVPMLALMPVLLRMLTATRAMAHVLVIMLVPALIGGVQTRCSAQGYLCCNSAPWLTAVIGKWLQSWLGILRIKATLKRDTFSCEPVHAIAWA